MNHFTLKYDVKYQLRNLYTQQLKILNEIEEGDSLYSGLAGKLLFQLMYSKIIGEEDTAMIEESLNNLITSSITDTNYTFCSGKSGLNWLFQFLYSNDVIEKRDLEILCEDDNELMVLSIIDLKSGNYDLLHGALGTAYYFLTRENDNREIYFKSVFKELLKLIDNNMSMFQGWDFENQKMVSNQVNMGFAHGIPGILKFCAKAFYLETCKKDAEYIALNIITFIVNNENVSTVESHFPSIIEKKQNNQDFSRLAWCYGDLSLAFSMYASSLIFENKEIENYSYNILKDTTQRLQIHETYVVDAGICHGSSGVAYIYYKLWIHTKDLDFKIASEYWISKTLEFISTEEGREGFLKYNPTNKSYEKDFSLLEGASGIGLILLSYISDDFSWDSCLFLD